MLRILYSDLRFLLKNLGFKLTIAAAMLYVLGFVVICGIIIVLYLMNDGIHTSDDVERYLGLNTLGLIPLEEGVSKKRTHGRDEVHKKKMTRKKAS